MATSDFALDWSLPPGSGTWRYDPIHYPDPTTPLSFELNCETLVRGMREWRSGRALPAGSGARYRNGYAFLPPFTPVPDERPFEERLEDAVQAGRRWWDEVLPEVQRHIDYYRTADFDAMDDGELVGAMDRLMHDSLRQGTLHAAATGPYRQATNLLVETYQEATGGSGMDAVRLVQG